MTTKPLPPQRCRDSREGLARRLAWPLAAAALVGASFGLGAWRWRRKTRYLRSRLEAARVAIPGGPYTIDELDGLPAPVQRYFRIALKSGQALIAAADIRQTGTFNMSLDGARWKAFTAEQRVVVRRPGFDWDARIRTFPGMTVRVRDAYIAGEGRLEASMWGLVPLADGRGTPEAAHGELIRYLAEAVWYPTALLPRQGVRWEAVDATSANATLSDGLTKATLLFVFDSAGLIEAVRAQARGATVGKAIVMTPWEGRWSNYQTRGGMHVPSEGVAAWLLPHGRRPYWRGSLTDIRYEYQTVPGIASA
jgi:hypothetical protein